MLPPSLAGHRGVEPRCSPLEGKPIPDHGPGGEKPTEGTLLCLSLHRAVVRRATLTTSLSPFVDPWRLELQFPGCRPGVFPFDDGPIKQLLLRRGGENRTRINRFPKPVDSHYPTPRKLGSRSQRKGSTLRPHPPESCTPRKSNPAPPLIKRVLYQNELGAHAQGS
jgi:hypothetical protein